MIEVTTGSGLNIESLVNHVSADFAKNDLEGKKVAMASVRVHTQKITSKRQERIKNLIDQMRGVVHQSGGCFKFLRVVFKIIDFLAKPLSLLTMNKLKMDLGKTLDMLKDSKNQQALLNVKIKGDRILKALTNLKKLLGDDMEQMKTQDEQSAKESQRVMRILNDIEETFKQT